MNERDVDKIVHEVVSENRPSEGLQEVRVLFRFHSQSYHFHPSVNFSLGYPNLWLKYIVNPRQQERLSEVHPVEASINNSLQTFRLM
jgi:hypothetical protein